MSVWSSEPPRVAGWYWVWFKDLERLVLLIEGDTVHLSGSEFSAKDSAARGAIRFGPRVPPVGTLSAREDVLALARQIDREFNPAGWEVDMPERLGGEKLMDRLCGLESLIAALDAARAKEADDAE